jgi:polar amino acid transport system substrate-binding protein
MRAKAGFAAANRTQPAGGQEIAMKKYLLAAVVLGTTLALTTLAAQAETIRFGFAAEPYPPFTSKDASGKWVGFEVDLKDAICAELKADCPIVEVAWDGIIPSLVANKFDVIWASMSITDKRKEVIDFTDRYYLTRAIVIGPKSETVKIDFANPDSLKGKIIGVQTSSIHAAYAQKQFGSTATIKVYATQDDADADLVAGRVDLVLADSIALSAFLKSDQGKEFDVKALAPRDPIFGIGAGGGLRKGETALQEKLNAAIAAVHANGTYDKIARKYFDFDVWGG